MFLWKKHGKNKPWEHDGTLTFCGKTHVLWEKSENTWGKEETMFQTGKVNATCIPPGDFAKF